MAGAGGSSIGKLQKRLAAVKSGWVDDGLCGDGMGYL
jgi:hypothetical protein